MDLASTHSSLTAIERDTTGNASRTLMAGLRRPGQRGVTTHGNADDCREMRNRTASHIRWLWAKLLQEEYPAEGYFMEYNGVENRGRFLVQTQDRLKGYSQEADDVAEWYGQPPKSLR